MNPTPSLVRKAMRECLKIGTEAFLGKYTKGFPPHYMYLRHDGVVYPLKALWAAAHKPAVSARTFNSVQARNGLKKLGFLDAVKIEDGDERVIALGHHKGLTAIFSADVAFEAAVEGERLTKEISFLKRNAGIVAKAKREHDCVCEVCDFSFTEAYGELGRNFIEAHHIEPLSTRSRQKKTTTISDFAMLCANCHRMIHRGARTLTVEELRAIIQHEQH